MAPLKTEDTTGFEKFSCWTRDARPLTWCQWHHKFSNGQFHKQIIFFLLEKLSTECRSLSQIFLRRELIFHSFTPDSGWKKRERSSFPNQIFHSRPSLSSPFDPLNLVTKNRFFRHSKIYDGKELFSSFCRWRSIKDLRVVGSKTLDKGLKSFPTADYVGRELSRTRIRLVFSHQESELKMDELWYARQSLVVC